MSEDFRKNLTALQESVTAKIIQTIEEGCPVWAKPWRAVGILPHNCITNRQYSGINVLMLWFAAQEVGYPTNQWLTFRQAQDVGAKVRKGEKSTRIIYVNFQEREINGETRKVPYTVLRYVFNVAQVDNIPLDYLGNYFRRPDEMAHRHAFDFLSQGVATEFGGSVAAYYPKTDRITMPARESFHDDPQFFGTWAHEHVHASGHESRLKRDMGRWGDNARTMEELVAELGSAFLCCDLDIPPTTRANASYIASWLKVMKGDSRAIFTAASRASQAVAYLKRERELTKEPEKEQEEEIEVAL